MQQILVIHGGDAFDTYEEYMQSLRDEEVSLEKRVKDWKSNLQDDLGEEYEVFTPRMPNSANARYAEWKIIFEKYLSLLSDDVILIGHSLGGIFLAKYLSERETPLATKAALLVAAPYTTREYEPLVDFILEDSLYRLRDAENLFFYHSRDDVVVPFESLERYQKELPRATVRIFEDKGHFNQEHFPELIEDIRNLV